MINEDALRSFGVSDAARARRNIVLLKERLGEDALGRLLHPILAAASSAGDPDMALNNLERFVDALTVVDRFASVCRDKPDALVSLMTVFGASRFLTNYITAAADESLERLSDKDYLSGAAGGKAMSERLSSMMRSVQGEKDLHRALRRFRKQEILRIGLRDLLGKADLQETVSDLSDLAETCLRAAYERISAGLMEKYGRPTAEGQDGNSQEAGFAVIAMGKLGGMELNFSSDIDLMYVYSSEGETEGVRSAEGAVSNRITNHQYFVRLSEKLTAAINENTEDGFVFRVDLRLRPEGRRGPIAQGLGGYEIYYESWGQTWERAALLKARPVAGDESVGWEFMERIAPFVYRKYLDFGAIAEIREMKQKINKDVQQKGRTYRDVKLGYGGIREIEFMIQALQLIYAGRDKALREKNSLKALHTLSQKGLLTYQETADLSRAYAFLRMVEHRIQILNDLQTQLIPSDERELRGLARRAGYRQAGKEAEAMLADYGLHTGRVREIYDNLLSQTAEEPVYESDRAEFSIMLDPETGEEDKVMALAQYGFKEPEKAYRNLNLLREGPAFVHQTPRSRKLFNEIFPLLFREIIKSPDPDMALNHLESYLASHGSWEAFRPFAERGELPAKMLIALFSNSEYLSRMLIRSPGLFEDLLYAGRGPAAASASSMKKELSAAAAKAVTVPEKLDALRRFKNREEMRIGLEDLLSSLSHTAVSRRLSKLAEACLDEALGMAASETGKRCGASGNLEGFAIIGAGKLGGRELTYGSDLDVMFVYSEERAKAPSRTTIFEYFSKTAEKTISYLTAMTREGAAYRVDTRLRPTGSKGPLVQSIEAFRSYYSTQAETWERQALINARFVAGDAKVGRELGEAMHGLIYRDQDAAGLAKDIREMRMRMERELGKEDAAHYNIKQGMGGLVDIEFIAQYLQLVHGREHKRLRTPGTHNALRALKKRGLLPPEQYKALKQAYLFLRLLESRMRIVTNLASKELTRDPGKLHALARRMGYEDEGAVSAGRKLLDDYERVRKDVRGAFEKIVG